MTGPGPPTRERWLAARQRAQNTVPELTAVEFDGRRARGRPLVCVQFGRTGADNVCLMEVARFGENEGTPDPVVRVAGGVRADAPGLDVAPDSSIDAAIALGRALVDNLSRVLLGTPGALTAAAMAALSGGHLLIEDVPGVGKTVLARALAATLGTDLSRVQGHPDLLPSDVTGVSVFAPDSGTWDFRPGPVFAHVVLVDELNRTPPRTQASLLEAMEEQQVSVDGESWPLPARTS